MNYLTVIISHRINTYLRSGELQSIASTLCYITAYTFCYIALTLWILTLWAVDVLVTPHFDTCWEPQDWELETVEPTPYIQSAEAAARQVRYTELAPTPRKTRKSRKPRISPATVASIAASLDALPTRHATPDSWEITDTDSSDYPTSKVLGYPVKFKVAA